MPKKSKRKIWATKVAFQGEIGAYSEEAAFKFFGGKIKTLPCQTFSDVFEMVEKGYVDFGIIPIENSLEGTVTVGQNYDLLLKSELKIFGEEILKISHCLIVNQGVKINSLKKVYSHPQALGQCREFLEKLKLKAIPVYDTAGALKMLKEEKAKETAAIASERAGKIYQMKILKRAIETNQQNFTRFLIISRKEAKKAKNSKTSIAFFLRNVPGALLKALEGFAKRKINLTKIESRPIMGKPWQYHFYLDFEGHKESQKVKEALEELKEKTLFSKVLGSYPATKKWK